jgi:predicted nucleic acid-binding protein
VSFAYLDASAFVKTIVREPESERLLAWLEQWPDRVSCALLRTEAVRAVRPHGQDAVGRARRALATISLIRLDDRLLDAAAEHGPPLRSLDAIHVAAAQALGAELGVIATYDERMSRAAEGLGLAVVAP